MFRAASSSAAALQRLQRAGLSNALMSVAASFGYLSAVSSVRPSAAFSVLHAGVARLSSAAFSAQSLDEFSLFVTKEGDKTWADVSAKRTVSIARLTEEVVKKLPSLHGKDLTTLALYVADADGKPKPDQKPLKSFDTLATALPNAAQPGYKYFLIIKELPSPINFPPLPPAITFTPVDLGGEVWMKASLSLSAGKTAPLFLTKAQHAELARFIAEAPSSLPQVLMPVGTIKSGKSTVLHKVLPRMLAARYATEWPHPRPQPVIFTYQFPLKASAEAAAMDLSLALKKFGIVINVPFPFNEHLGSRYALDNLGANLGDFAQCIKNRGGELWLLLDELQVPGLHSTPYDAERFVVQFKSIVEHVSPFGRIAVTGSGLITLLNSIRSAPVNGFALWDAVSFVSLGRQPEASAALSMATVIHQAYAADWNTDARLAITSESVVHKLEPRAQGGRTSPRPALVAYALACMGDAKRGTPDEVVRAALVNVLDKVETEAIRDTAYALANLDAAERRLLLDVATGGYSVAELEKAIHTGMDIFKKTGTATKPALKLGKLLALLCEEGTGSDIVRLQPPYPALLTSWISPTGELASRVDGVKPLLDENTSRILVCIGVERNKIPLALRHKMGKVLLDSFARNGVGIYDKCGCCRAPQTAAEFDSIVIFRALHTSLSHRNRSRSLDRALMHAASATPSATDATFQESIGWELLLAFRNLHAHVWDQTTLRRTGLRSAVIAECIYDVACVLTEADDSCFELDGPVLAVRPEAT